MDTEIVSLTDFIDRRNRGETMMVVALMAYGFRDRDDRVGSGIYRKADDDHPERRRPIEVPLEPPVLAVGAAQAGAAVAEMVSEPEVERKVEVRQLEMF